MEILIPITLFVMIAVISLAAIAAGHRAKRDLHETFRRALDAGQTLDAETLHALSKPQRSAAQDFRGGVILVSLGLGLVLAGVLASGVLGGGGDLESAMGIWIAAIIVGSIGAGQIAAGSIRNDRKGK